MQFKILTICLLSLLIIGAGCTKKPSQTSVTSTPKVVVIKKPVNNTGNVINAYCENQGFELIIRFNKKTENSQSFCRFKNGTECDAVEFYKKTCSPETASKNSIEINPGNMGQDISICTNEFKPVCGADGINYTNPCLAQIQGVKIVHERVCTEKEIIKQKIYESLSTPEDEDSTVIISSNNTQSNTSNEWLPLLKDMALNSSVSYPPAFIEKCQINGQTYYYRTDGCASCFSSLYGSNGQIMCYPQNDIDNSCPMEFTSTNRKNSCARIWQDPR